VDVVTTELHACPVGPTCTCPENRTSRLDALRELAAAFLATALDWCERALADAHPAPLRAVGSLAIARIALTAARSVLRSADTEVRP
jgi:hypothetical protein